MKRRKVTKRSMGTIGTIEGLDEHRHQWVYGPRSVAGWGIARCTTCPSWDIY